MKFLSIAFLLILCLPSSLISNELQFTAQEKAWLEKHPVIKVSNEDDWAPFDFSVDGVAKGYSIDIIKNLADKIGLKVEFVNGYSWAELLGEFDKKNIDLMHVMTKDKQRISKYSFSKPYMPWRVSYMIRSDEKDIHSPKDFKGKKIAAGEGWSTTKLLKKMYPKATIIAYKNSSEILQALSTSKVDVGIDNILATNYAMSENVVTNVVHGGYLQLKDKQKNNFHFVSHKDSPELVSIFDKAYVLLSVAEKLKIQKKWFVYAEANHISFTKEENQWISDNPTVIMGGEMDWAPFDYVDKHGNYQGVIKDYIKLFEIKSTLKFDIKTGMTWDELIEALKKREIDFIPSIFILTPERAKFGFATKQYINLKNRLYVREDEKNIKSIKDIKVSKIAVIKGYATVDHLKPSLDNAEIITVANLKEAIYAVLNKKVDGFVDVQMVVDYTLKESFITGLKSIPLPYLTEDNGIKMLVRNDKAILHSILEKLIASISDEEKNNILDNWITFNGLSSPNIELTNKEKRYLKNKKAITMCIDPDWMPFEKFDEKGNHIGMTADYYKKFTKDLGIPIHLIKTKTWSESLEAAKKRECDILSLTMGTKDKKEYMNFTSTYVEIPLIIATKLNVTFFDDLNYIKDEKIGIVKGYAFNEIIRRKYPNIHVVDVDSLTEGLQKVADGELFGMIDSLASVGYMFQTKFIGELKIAGKFEEKWELGIGVRNDDLMLLNILEKSVQNLTPEQKQTIYSKYIAIKYEKGNDYIFLIKVLAGIFLIIIVGTYHIFQKRQNIKLEEKVAEQTEFLNILFKELQHRVKNNFQFILTFLWAQKQSSSQDETNIALDQVRDRINAIIHLHDTLDNYEHNNPNIQKYFHKLLETFRITNPDVIIESDINALETNYTTSVNLGLIVNELLTNSFKYAFADTQRPCIHITLTQLDKKITFIYKDNGSGFDTNLIGESRGFGYEFINEFTQKFKNARNEVDGNKGFYFILTFDLEEEDANA